MPSDPSPSPSASPALESGGSTVVLFDLPADQFPGFAADLRRLTGRDVSFRWRPTPEGDPGRVLVRVEGPPPLIVWRVQDAAGMSPGPSPRVFVETAPGVWASPGHRLPLDRTHQPPDGHILLLRDGEEPEILAGGEFTTGLDALPLPAVLRAHAAGSAVPPIPVRLRLVPAPDRSAPRLWVLREEALSGLTAYCRTTHGQLLSRFTAAASASAGQPCVVLRAGTAKGPPPLFVGPAVAFQPHPGLPGLYLPAGTRLAPLVRRDVLRKAFNLTGNRVVWLHPLGDGGFRAESLPESAFRPLTDWVDYRLTAGPRALQPWAQSHPWTLEPFTEQAESEPRVVRPPASTSPPAAPARKGFLARIVHALKVWHRRRRLRKDRRRRAASAERPTSGSRPASGRLHLARPEPTRRAREQCGVLEARLLQAGPGLDAEPRADAWADLAAAYDDAGHYPDAALCWLNALWRQQQPSADWAWSWLRAEARAARPEVKAIDPIPWLVGQPGPGTTRALAAWVVWACAYDLLPPVFRVRAADIQTRLESHEHWLPVRAAWLARLAITRRGGGDVLGLARTRDRLAERLRGGLSLELDAPSFLRFTGEGMRERFQDARRWLADRRSLIHQWLARLPEDARVHVGPDGGSDHLRQVGLEPDVAHTRAYADLVLAWGLARFAEQTGAENIRRQAASSLPTDDPVHALLRDAFEYRITQVRAGKPPRGPLPASLRRRIASLDGIPRYAVDKLREHSRILEPTAWVNGFGNALAAADRADPASVLEAVPPDRLDEQAAALLAASGDPNDGRHLAATLVAVLDRAEELSESGIGPAFVALPAALDGARGDVPAWIRLIAAGLGAAVRFDRPEVARFLVGRFLRFLDERSRWDVAEALTGPAVRSLRRLGLPGEADRALEDVASHVLQGKPLDRVRASRPGDWPAALRVLLHVAGGWYAAGKDGPAHAVLDEARLDLFAPGPTPAERTALARAYAATLAHAPARIALGRLEEMFQRLRGVTVGGTVNAYYSLQPLLIVETAVRAVVSDDFTLGLQVRSWLDSDELAIRRRIRDELKELLAGQGL